MIITALAHTYWTYGKFTAMIFQTLLNVSSCVYGYHVILIFKPWFIDYIWFYLNEIIIVRLLIVKVNKISVVPFFWLQLCSLLNLDIFNAVY
jgi:hypothetical protein